MMGKEIDVPFMPRFREPILSGRKTMTSRTRKLGEPGDWFLAFGAKCELFGVAEGKLGIVADWWDAEGCESRRDFVTVWNQIHPIRLFMKDDLVWVHRFRLSDGPEKAKELIQRIRETW